MRRPWITCPLLLALGVFALSLVPYAPDWWAMLMCSVTTPLLGLLYGHLPLWAVNGVLAFVHYALLAGALAGAGFLGKRAYQSASRSETARLRVTYVWYLAQQLAQDVVADLRDLLAWPWAVRLCGGACRFGLRGYELMRTPVAAGTLAFLGVVVFLFLVWGPISAFLGASAASGSGAADASPSNLEIIYKLSLIIGGITAFALAAWRGWCHDRQTRTTMQGHITDRFIKASELLGSDQMASRLGGIFMLWRTGKDSPNVDDKRAVLDMLCAFIREPTPDASCDCGKVEDGTEAKGTAKGERETLRNDVRSALALLAPQEQKTLPVPPGYRFDLTGAELPKAELSGAKLDGAQLSHVDFRGAGLARASLNAAALDNANLCEAKLPDADLVGACLIYSNCFYVDFKGAKLVESDLYGANLYGSDLTKTDLSDAKMINVNMRNAVMDKANLTHSILIDANLVESKIVEAKMTGALLLGAKLNRADLSGTDMSSADFTMANLSESNLSAATFLDARFYRSNLIGAYLRMPRPASTGLTSTGFLNLMDVDWLSEHVPITREHFADAYTIEGAIFTGDSCPWPQNDDHGIGRIFS